MAKYSEMSPGEMVTQCGDDAVKWAEAFCQFNPQSPHDVASMAAWFANAIETACDKRAGRIHNGDHAQFLIDRAKAESRS